MSHKKILFVGGMPRSGTTLLRDVFKTSQDIFVLNSDYCLYSNFENLNKYSRFPKNPRIESIIEWYSTLVKVSPVHQWNIDSAVLKPNIQEASFKGFCDAMYLTLISQNDEIDNFVFKSPRLEFYFHEIAVRPWLANFKVNFAYIHRNPFDQTKSLKYASHAWNKPNQYNKIALSNGLAWRDSLLYFSYFKEHYNDSSILISYNDLVSSKQEFSEIEAFFNSKLDLSRALNRGGATSSILSFKGHAGLDENEVNIIKCITKIAGQTLYPELYLNAEYSNTKILQLAYAHSLSVFGLRIALQLWLIKIPSSIKVKIHFLIRKLKKKLRF